MGRIPWIQGAVNAGQEGLVVKCAVWSSETNHAPAIVVCSCCGAGFCGHHARELVVDDRTVKPCPRCAVPWTSEVDDVLLVRRIVTEVMETPDLISVAARPVRDFLNLAQQVLGAELVQTTCRRAIAISYRRALEVASASSTHREHLAGIYGLGSV